MDISHYSPLIRALLSEDRLAPLGPGSPQEEQRGPLQRLTSANLFAPGAVRQPEFASACLAGLWLYFDFLDEAHNLSQALDTVEGSWWHGIMHRREPDYANAAYWFRRVGRHPLFGPLGAAAAELATTLDPQVAIPSPWDPFWLIDYCEACARQPGPSEKLARLIQQREWQLLFDYCYRNALGR